MNSFGIKQKSVKDRAIEIIERDRKQGTLESLIHNYSKDEKKQEKILMSPEEFFKEKENE